MVWESEQEQYLMRVLNEIHPIIGRTYTWAWKADENGVYTVKSTYKILQGNA